jgi:hypothetical protein
VNQRALGHFQQFIWRLQVTAGELVLFAEGLIFPKLVVVTKVLVSMMKDFAGDANKNMIFIPFNQRIKFIWQ